MKLGLLLLVVLIIGQTLGEEVNLSFETTLDTTGNIDETMPQSMVTDLEDFAYGVFLGIKAAEKWDNAKRCISRDKTTYTYLQQSCAEITTKKPAHVKKGIHNMGMALQTIPEALKDCGVLFSDLDGLISAVYAFTNPVTFYYRIGISLLINGYEIYKDIDGAMAAYKAQNWTAFGYYIGNALVLIYFKGEGPVVSEEFHQHLTSVADWKAEIIPLFESMTVDQLNSWLVQVPFGSKTETMTEFDYRGYDGVLPENFNAYLSPPLDFPEERITVRNPESMKYLISSYGPVEAHMRVYEDFLYYKDGIYRHLCGKYIGTHAVRVIGWGVEQGVNYWLIENNWSPDWGQYGLAKIAFGECDIDSLAMTGFWLDWNDRFD